MDAAVNGGARQEIAGLSAAQPVVYANLTGLFTAAAGAEHPKGFAVLFLSPWGLEEFLTRKFYRHLADRFAASGIASLRFDYPGTANAPDDVSGDGLDAWMAAVDASAAELMALAGVSRIVVLGQGLGAGLACRYASAAQDVAGLALLAPVFKGRGYLRELKLWSKFVDDGLGLKPENRDGTPGAIAGIRMAEKLIADLKTFDVSGLEFHSAMPVLLAPRPGVEIDPFVLEKLAAAGCDVRSTVYRGYETLLTDASPPDLPVTFGDDLVEWLEALPEWTTQAGPPSRLPGAAALVGENYRETPIRFGENNRLIGTLCEPVGQSAGVTAVILSTSYDYQIGWGRMNVELARRLAEKGVASLRFDGADIGDSPPVPGRRAQVLYDDKQTDDAELAYEFLRSHGFGKNVLVVGRCSGAYAAFRTALRGPHWNGCVVINPYGFCWRFIGLPWTMKEYWSKIREPGLMARILQGRVDVKAAAVNIFVRLTDRGARQLSKVFPQVPKFTQRNRKVHEEFRKLSDRGTRLTIVYSEGDEAMESFLINFGEDAEGLAAYPNATLHYIPDADHNLTPRRARARLFQIIEDTALLLSPSRSS